MTEYLHRTRELLGDVEYRLVSVLIDLYTNGWVKYTELRNELAGRCCIRPDEVVWVDPARIEYSLDWNVLSERGEVERPAHFEKPKYRIAGTVLGGRWDETERQFEDSVVYRSFVDHFVEGAPWAETDLYESVTERIAAGERWWRCSTLECFDRRCEELDRLYREIDRNGYRTQCDLVAGSETTTLHERGARNTTPSQVVRSEIAVTVGRDGELLFFDGRNRLSIAKILDLESVPVVVLVRHERWQGLREDVAAGAIRLGDLPERIRTHPDIPPCQ